MAGMIPVFSVIPDEIILLIVDHLDSDDRIAFSSACYRFRQICLNNRRVMRKVDLSRCMVKRQNGLIKEFLTEKLMVQHIRELNLNNQRVMNWQMNANLIEFITHCPQLEALHVLNTGVTLKCLDHILQNALNLVTLSFFIMDVLAEDVELFIQCWRSDDGFRLKNIKSLHIEIPFSTLHFKVLKYLVLCCCKSLEELEIIIWTMPELVSVGDALEFERKGIKMDPGFLCQWPPAMTDSLQHFNSLTLQTMFFSSESRYTLNAPDLSDFLITLLQKKSHNLKWKRLWISPSINCDNLLDKCGVDMLTSVEALSVNNAFKKNEVEILFQRISDGVVRSLQLQNGICNEFLKRIVRIGGAALQCLCLSHICETDLNAKLVFKMLFSSCSNIRELDLLGCHFQNNICESLAKLKHLSKLLLHKCAIAPDLTEGNAKLLTLVENCPSVIEFDARGCTVSMCLISRLIADNDLLPLSKWSKLKSFTSIAITKQCNKKSSAMPEKQHKYAFIDQILENCKLLTMLRIAVEDFDRTYFTKFRSANLLKHLSIYLLEVDLGSEDFWMFLSYARNLERLCIRSNFEGLLSVDGAVEMLKMLPRLHVLHVHFHFAENVGMFCRHMVKTLEESDRSSCFEFVMEEDVFLARQYCIHKNVLPTNISELCYFKPSLPLSKF